MIRQFYVMFSSFFKIGCFTFGGGYAMIPLIQKEVVEKHRWVGSEEFLNMLGVAQSAPGPIAVNISILIGYRISRRAGALAAFLGTVLPSFVILLAVAMCFAGIYRNPVVDSIFKGVRPAVAALILHPVFSLSKGMKYREYGVLAAVAAAIGLKISPVWFIACAVVVGIALAYWKSHRLNRS